MPTDPEAWSETVVDLGEVMIRVTRGGEPGHPPIVFVHGFTDSGRCWERAALALAPGREVFLPDARNHGRSSTGPDGPDALAADLIGVIDALGLDRPVLVGHSIGARTAASVAADHPERVALLVLEDPPWRAEDEHLVERSGDSSAPDDRVAVVHDHLAGLAASSFEELMDLARTQHPEWPPTEYPAWVEAKQLVRPEAAAAVAMTAWGPVVRAISCQTLLIFGEHDRGGIVTPEVARRVTSANDVIMARQIIGAGHSIRREQFDAYIKVVAAFLGPS